MATIKNQENEDKTSRDVSGESPRPALVGCPCCGAEAGFGQIRFSEPPPISEEDGSRPMVRRYVHCAYCQMNNNGIVHGYATEQQAADAWNRRADERQPIESAPDAVLERVGGGDEKA